MHKPCLVVLVVAAVLAASVAGALEKAAVRATDVERGDWDVSYTITVAYYNYCTGWIWLWAGWSPNDVIGVCYTCPLPEWDCAACVTRVLVYTAAPPGYGFTGSVDLWDTDSGCCPVSYIVGQPFYFYSGWNTHAWGWTELGQKVVMTVTFGPAPGTPSRMASDHPAHGPTGPQACGFCYSIPRTCHSYYFGTATSPYCPGVSMSDGICCVEWVWEFGFCNPIDLQPSSWGNIKALYR
jgi:hypothetical protein